MKSCGGVLQRKRFGESRIAKWNLVLCLALVCGFCLALSSEAAIASQPAAAADRAIMDSSRSPNFLVMQLANPKLASMQLVVQLTATALQPGST